MKYEWHVLFNTLLIHLLISLILCYRHSSNSGMTFVWTAVVGTVQFHNLTTRYGDVIMSTMAYKITGVSIVCSTVCSDADQRKCQSSAPLALVSGIHRWPVDSAHKGPVTRIMSPFDDVIMQCSPKCLNWLAMATCGCCELKIWLISPLSLLIRYRVIALECIITRDRSVAIRT